MKTAEKEMQRCVSLFIGCTIFVLLLSWGSQAHASNYQLPVDSGVALFAEASTGSGSGTLTNRSEKESDTAPLVLSINEAALLSLENNKEFQVERLNPEISRTFEIEEQAVFDPDLSATYTKSRESKEAAGSVMITEGDYTQAEVATTLPTGTDIGVEISSIRSNTSTSSRQNKFRGGLSITQALLEGFGSDVNLAKVRQARLTTLVSQYELRGAAELLVSEVEKICWELLLAKQRITIFNDSLKLAEDQLLETQERIEVGKLAAVELYAAQAEVALRREALINARSNLSLSRLQLQGLLQLPGNTRWNREINVVDQVVVPEDTIDDPAKHTSVALKWRPELNQARLEMKQGDIEIVKTKNGLLPVLDFFITLGKSGYSDSFGSSINQLDGESYDISGGLAFDFPMNKRAAKARHQRARLSRQQAEEAYQNLIRIVEIDVRSAIIEINRTKEQITATAATRKLQEESLKGETEKFRVGKSTALLVAQTQRDLIVSQIAEVESLVKYLKALIELYRLDGSLLERRGIVAPGQDSVPFPF